MGKLIRNNLYLTQYTIIQYTNNFDFSKNISLDLTKCEIKCFIEICLSSGYN